jgi:hypothetical protein
VNFVVAPPARAFEPPPGPPRARRCGRVRQVRREILRQIIREEAGLGARPGCGRSRISARPSGIWLAGRRRTSAGQRRQCSPMNGSSRGGRVLDRGCPQKTALRVVRHPATARSCGLSPRHSGPARRRAPCGRRGPSISSPRANASTTPGWWLGLIPGLVAKLPRGPGSQQPWRISGGRRPYDQVTDQVLLLTACSGRLK